MLIAFAIISLRWCLRLADIFRFLHYAYAILTSRQRHVFLLRHDIIRHAIIDDIATIIDYAFFTPLMPFHLFHWDWYAFIDTFSRPFSVIEGLAFAIDSQLSAESLTERQPQSAIDTFHYYFHFRQLAIISLMPADTILILPLLPDSHCTLLTLFSMTLLATVDIDITILPLILSFLFLSFFLSLLWVRLDSHWAIAGCHVIAFILLNIFSPFSSLASHGASLRYCFLTSFTMLRLATLRWRCARAALRHDYCFDRQSWHSR